MTMVKLDANNTYHIAIKDEVRLLISISFLYSLNLQRCLKFIYDSWASLLEHCPWILYYFT